ncbi:MAG: putative transporter substrate binding protein [Anaerolineales bacterium]|nr:putative transporter substrate binding protein [Anaerolineales bacterium]
MRHLRWQALIAVLGMILVGGLLAGQGQRVAVEQRPERGGVYIEALVGAPRALNPLLDRANPVDRDLGRLIFSGLTRFDASGRPAPDLANWSISADQTTYTFVLKPTLKWHDEQPLTADDVAFTVALLQDPAYPGPADVGRLWQSVKVQVVNPQTVVFTLPEPFAPFLDYTTVGLLPRHLLNGKTAADLPNLDFNLKPVGSGPFAFRRWLTEGDRVTGIALTAFPDYAGQQPLLNEIQFNLYPDEASAFAAYRQNPEKILGLSRLGEAQVAEALKMPQLSLYTSVLPEYSLIFLNLQSDELPFFKEKKVRQALLYGLNRPAIVTDILKGQAVVADSPVLPGSWAYNSNLPKAGYDPQTATSLLEAAGWVLPEGAVAGAESYVRQKGGAPLRFTLITPNDPAHVAVANAAKTTWAALGVQVAVTPVDPASLHSQYLEPRPRVFQAILVDLNFAGTPDPDPYPLWHQTRVESGQNYSGLDDRVISQLLEEARITTDINLRARNYRAFQSRFVDQVPALLLYYPVYNYAVDARVNGVQIGPLTEPSDRFNTIAGWYLITSKVIVENPLQGVERPGGGTAPTATP